MTLTTDDTVPYLFESSGCLCVRRRTGAPLGSAQPRLVCGLLGADLATACKAQLRLLRALHAHSEPFRSPGPLLDEALRRYTNFFLPFLAEWTRSSGRLVPPLDCAFLWHCHRLSPVSYAADCTSRFGKLLDVPSGSAASAFSAPVESPGRRCRTHGDATATRGAWAKEFPDEPFDLVVDEVAARAAAMPSLPPLRAALAACAVRQARFLWQVAGPQYHDDAFLDDAVRRYVLLLWLMRTPKAFRVPTYDMDIVWHAHLAHPGLYAADCRALVGRLVDHDDSVNDRAPGSKLTTGAGGTAAAWAAAFPSDAGWAKRGGTWRGEPPDNFFDLAL